MNMPLLLLVISACFLIAAMLFSFPRDVRAEFYRYKDAGGTIVITNRLEDVPKKYRNKVKVIWDEELAAKDPLSRRKAAAEAQREQQQRQQVQNRESNSDPGAKQPSDGKKLVITYDEATGQLIRTME